MSSELEELITAEQFVERNIVAADNDRIVCGDGRYTPEQSAGAIRAFGGDFGIIMAYQGALVQLGFMIEARDLVEHYLFAVNKLRGEKGGHYHSDEHNHEQGKIGCSHIAKSSDPDLEKLYAPLTAEHVRKLYEVFDEHEDTEQVVLGGVHDELGVLLVYGIDDKDPKYSVNSRDMDTHEKYFVVDVARAERFIKAFTPHLSAEFDIPINSEGVVEAFHKQMAASAGELAEGKMQYKVVFDENGKSKVTPISRVAKKASN